MNDEAHSQVQTSYQIDKDVEEWVRAGKIKRQQQQKEKMTTDLVVAGAVKEGKREKDQGIRMGAEKSGLVGGVPLQSQKQEIVNTLVGMGSSMREFSSEVEGKLEKAY